LGPEHPDVALGLNNLAGVYHNQGESAKAASLLARALGICEKSLGPNHPNTSVVRENYTGMLKKPGAKRKARKKGKPGAR
ncbi:MAG TPA: tetratricopeptide repeat protein, partial [Pyrinomonadaceae bacterium]|nr:tetratricopeptide repeat protein [Pyrinomonadaceae bacterium]